VSVQPTPTVNPDYVVETLSALARVPTHVDPGWDTLIEPDHPRLVHYVQEVVRPELVRLGVGELLDVPRNNLVARAGRDAGGRRVLIQAYTPAQHHNLMRDPLSGRIAWADTPAGRRRVVFGQGVSQVKAHTAVMLAVLRLLRDEGVDLRGCVYWAMNNEGRSSHACSEAIVAALPSRPDFGIVQHGTGLAISIGNRGRVDIDVHVRGRLTHSSTPELGASAIDGAVEVMNRLRTISWPDRHPLLGGRQAIPYKVRFEPVLPHTLPSDAWVTVDRRMLPGDDPEEARREIEEALAGIEPWEVTVRAGVHMWPALVEPDDPGVAALAAAHEAVAGNAAALVYGRGSFDAGGPCRLGIPTVMYGVKGGDWPAGDDWVAIDDVLVEANTLAAFVIAFAG
jgi:acetylornithine deacetylase/succinyl-diaminopimelate desuccinylase-like protein